MRSMCIVDGHLVDTRPPARRASGHPDVIDRRGWRIVGVTLTLLVASCGSDWAEVHEVTARQKSDTNVNVNYDICWTSNDPMPKAKVVDSDTQVRITSAVKARGGDSKACLTVENVPSTSPIGDRSVVDGRTGQKFAVSFTG